MKFTIFTWSAPIRLPLFEEIDVRIKWKKNKQQRGYHKSNYKFQSHISCEKSSRNFGIFGSYITTLYFRRTDSPCSLVNMLFK